MTEQGNLGFQPDEQLNPLPEEHEGERYLRLLNLEHLAFEPLPLEDGRIVMGRDFLESEKCAVRARPILTGFEAMSPDDPQYEVTREALVKYIGRYINPNLIHPPESNNE